MEKLTRLLPCDHQELQSATCRLLLNLSFDTALRGQMVRAGLVPRLSSLLGKRFPWLRASCLGGGSEASPGADPIAEHN